MLSLNLIATYWVLAYQLCWEHNPNPIRRVNYIVLANNLESVAIKNIRKLVTGSKILLRLNFVF